MKSEKVKTVEYTAVYVLYEISEMLSVSGLWAPDSSGYPLYSRALYWDEQKKTELGHSLASLSGARHREQTVLSRR